MCNRVFSNRRILRLRMAWSPWATLLIALACAGSAGCAPGADGSSATPAAALRITHANPDQAATFLAEKAIVVLDIRTPKEYAAGHLKGATNIDFHAKDFAARLEGLDRQRTYLVHCASGRRSTESLPVFRQLGFQSIIHLDGGFKAWAAAGQPVER